MMAVNLRISVMTVDGISPSPNPPSAKRADRLVVDVEIVRRGAERAGHHPLLPFRDSFQRQAHVRRQSESAAAAERIPFGFLETAARTVPPFGQLGDLLPGNHRNPSLPWGQG